MFQPLRQTANQERRRSPGLRGLLQVQHSLPSLAGTNPALLLVSHSLLYTSIYIISRALSSSLSLVCNPLLSFASHLSLLTQSQLYSSRGQISLHFGNRGAVSRSVTLQHTLSNHDNAGEAQRGSGALFAVRPYRVKNLHHSKLWITVPLPLTGVYSSC